jgi:hypothetical protein
MSIFASAFEWVQLVEEVAKHDTSEQSWDVLPEGAKLAQMCPQHGDIIVGQERWPEVGRRIIQLSHDA